MGDSRRRANRDAVCQPARECVDGGNRPVGTRLPLGAPPADLALDEAVRAAEAGQAGRRGIDGVQVGEAVRECVPESLALRVPGCEPWGQPVPDDQAGHPGHHVARHAEQVPVVAGDDSRDGHGGAGECPLHPDLALHVVRGRQDGAIRRPPQDQFARRTAQEICQIRLPAGHEAGLDLAPPVVTSRTAQQRAEQVRPGQRLRVARRARHAPTVSSLRRGGLAVAVLSRWLRHQANDQ